MARTAQSRRWCFTINNPTSAHIERLTSIEVVYLVYGVESAPSTGTRHLQGFVIFENPRRRNGIVSEIGGGHFEVARGTSIQAADYCKKDGDYTERGALPNNGGRRTDIEAILSWLDSFIAEHGRAPTDRETARLYPTALFRYRNFGYVARLRAPQPPIRQGEPREWQASLRDELLEDADDRTIQFYVDENGGKGKSWFQEWFYSLDPDRTQLLNVGKRDDLAHSLSVDHNVFLFNIPRGAIEFLQYTILEQLKDRTVFSPKYDSHMKMWRKNNHVVVFTNEEPDMTKLSRDRYKIVHL